EAAAVQRAGGDVGKVLDTRLKFEQNREKTNVFVKSIIDHIREIAELQYDPARKAAFEVLKSISVPSVVVTLGNINNQSDFANLTSDGWRERVSSSLVAAIDAYFVAYFAQMPNAAPPPGAQCRVWTAGDIGQNALIIRSIDAGKVVNYTVLA